MHYNYGQTVGSPGWQVCVPPSYPIIGMAFKYDNLFEFFRTGKAYGLGFRGISGNWQYCDPTLVYFGQEFRERIAFEILGRMCHLLQDMSVPAHANLDPHGDDPALIDDYYESYFGYDYYWNAQNVYTQIGGMINPYLYQPSNPLHFLMYTTNQMANHFATQGPHKKFNNDYFSGNGTSAEIAYLNSLNVSLFGIPTSDNGPWNYDAIMNVRNKMLPQAIRATAGLLYWFANECNLIPPPPPIAPIISNFSQTPNPLYRGNNGSVTCNLSQGNGSLNFNWSIVSGNTGFSISNVNSQSVSIHYSNTDAIEKTISENVSSPKETPIEGPTGAVLKCKVWNSAGTDSANAFINLATTPHGCPFVYTWYGGTWVEDNNILPQSQDPDLLGQDVTDFYQLYTKPVLEEGKYYLAVGEFEEEISYLDQLKLLVVDHPQETFITVDDEGEIIQFAKPAYFANAQLDSIDVYKKLVGLDSIKAEVSIDDTLSLSFEDVSIGTEKWLLLIGQQEPIYKDKIAGSVLGGGKENTTTFSSFRLRKNPTYQWVLVPDGNSSTLQVDIAFQSEAEIDYTELSHKLELPFTVYTPQLLYAEHSIYGDVTSLMNQTDEQYSVLNTDEMITLEYSAPPINEGMERTFIFVSRGRYERLENNMLAKGKSHIENKNQKTASTENINIVYEYGLSQNYPNPFNPVTTVSYQIKEQGLVQLKVYNLLGQEIVTLVNEEQPSGIYEALFDASNLPSGVYIYSLRVNGFVQNNKMTLLK